MQRFITERKAPSRKVKQIDNRGSSYYVGLYWAQEMAKHDQSFKNLADALAANEEQISKELIDCQGPSVDIGGYFRPNATMVEKAMRPCQLLNDILEKNQILERTRSHLNNNLIVASVVKATMANIGFIHNFI